MNAVRREALNLLARTDDDLSDRELFAQQATDEYWYVDLALTQFHRLPSEMDRVLLCREYTVLQAHSVIQRAMTILREMFKEG